MVPFQKRILFALLVLLESVDLSADGVGFWCDTVKYNCHRHSSGIAEKNAASGPAPVRAPAAGPTPVFEENEETVDPPGVIDAPGSGGWDPIKPPEIIDVPGSGEEPTSAPLSDDKRGFPVLPFVAIAAGGGLLVSLFFYLRRRQNPSDASAEEVDEPDVTP